VPSARDREAREYRAAMATIQERWDRLIATEREYRLEGSDPSPTTATPGHNLAAGIA